MNIAPLRVIIVDDSGEVLSALGRIIDKQPDMELLGVASSVDDGVLSFSTSTCRTAGDSEPRKSSLWLFPARA
jgi:hypothetical protein